jgi:membrane fusion protein, multidrug efflux system
VKVADVPIVVINQVNPIFVNFAVPQQYWFTITKYMKEGMLHANATVPKNPGPPEEGTVTFIDNAVDATTGMIHLRATFTNSENHLWPGLYANIVLTLSQQSGATVVPSQAIVQGEKGPFVYIVKPDKRVEPRSIVSSRTIQGETVVDKGLETGETIVIDGQGRLQPNSLVEIKTSVRNVAPAESSVGHSQNSGKP